MEFLFSYGWRRAFQPLPVPVFPSGSVELMPQPKGVFLYCGGRCPILAGHGCAPEWCPAYNTHPAKVNCGLRLASCGRMKTTEKTKKTAVVDLPWVKQGRANSKRRASARSFISVASNKNRKRNHPTSRCSSQSAILSGSYRHSRPCDIGERFRLVTTPSESPGAGLSICIVQRRLMQCYDCEDS
jgi:hypothetical protein